METMTTVLAIKKGSLQTFILSGSAQQCPQDSKGTVIVPIVVGAALGGLVLVVILAYAISWIVQRKKSGSYAALN